MNRLECLADAFAKMNGMHNPESVAYQLRNPLMLKAFSVKQNTDGNGYRIFDSLVDGIQAAIYDLKTKCSGKSRSKLKPTSVLSHLVAVYGNQSPAAVDYIVSFVRRALNDHSVTASTPLSYFLE